MDYDENTRRKIRLSAKEPADSYYFYTSAYNEQEEINQKILVAIESTIQKLMDDDLENKIETLKTLNQMLKSHQKYIIPKISDEVIDKICSLTAFTNTECLSLQFLNIFIQLCPNLYQYLIKTNFYSNLIQRIQPNENVSFYRQILFFLSTTIKKIPESISMMLEFGILENIKNMDQTQFIEQLQVIYSSSFIQTPDFTILDSILFYLTFQKSEFIIETLTCLKRCISDITILEKVWDNICFDERLISLLLNDNSDVVSTTISVFSMIFAISDETIHILFDNMELLNTIINNLFGEDMSLNASIFDFLISLVKSTNDDSNITNIFELIREMSIDTKKIEFLSFLNQKKAAYLIFNLYLKISCQQIELLFNPDLLRLMIQILQEDEEDMHFCIQSIHFLMSKISSNENIIKSISDIISEADLNDDIFDASIE